MELGEDVSYPWVLVTSACIMDTEVCWELQRYLANNPWAEELHAVVNNEMCNRIGSL